MSIPARIRRLALSLVLVVLVAALGVSVLRTLPAPDPRVSVAATPTGPYFSRYTFAAEQLPDVLTSVRPGQIITLVWNPKRDDSRLVYSPKPVTCSAALLGPFADRSAADEAAKALLKSGGRSGTSDGGGSPLIPAVAWPSLAIDDFIDTVQVDQLGLPLRLAQGYYVLHARELDAYGASESDQVLTIAPAAP